MGKIRAESAAAVRSPFPPAAGTSMVRHNDMIPNDVERTSSKHSQIGIGLQTKCRLALGEFESEADHVEGEGDLHVHW